MLVPRVSGEVDSKLSPPLASEFESVTSFSGSYADTIKLSMNSPQNKARISCNTSLGKTRRIPKVVDDLRRSISYICRRAVVRSAQVAPIKRYCLPQFPSKALAFLRGGVFVLGQSSATGHLEVLYTLTFSKRAYGIAIFHLGLRYCTSRGRARQYPHGDSAKSDALIIFSVIRQLKSCCWDCSQRLLPAPTTTKCSILSLWN